MSRNPLIHESTYMLIAFKTRLHANNAQVAFFNNCLSARRVAFNFALGTWSEMYEAHKLDPTLPKPSAFDIDKIYNNIKAEKYPWMFDEKGRLLAPSCVAQEAIKSDIKLAFKNFFDRVKKGGAPGYPKFKKRHDVFSFKFTSNVVNNKHIVTGKLQLPKGFGTCRLGDQPPDGVIKCTTISNRAGKWWVSFLLETEREYKSAPIDTPVGIDMGIARFATLSNGEYYESIRPDNRLKRMQRKLAKMTRGSNRYGIQKARIATLYKKTSDVRSNHAHQITSVMSRSHDTIVIEDLNVKNMTKSASSTVDEPGKKVAQKRGLNRSLLNQGFFEFRRQLEYKTARHGGVLIAVNPRYTSQTCSVCGIVDKASRKTQSNFACTGCGHTENADLNAAKNILRLGFR